MYGIIATATRQDGLTIHIKRARVPATNADIATNEGPYDVYRVVHYYAGGGNQYTTEHSTEKRAREWANRLWRSERPNPYR